MLNLAVTERSVRLVVAEPVSAFAARLVFLLRLFVLLAAIFVSLALLDAEPVPFAAGLLLIVPAALWHGISRAHEA